jgi:hypothetical protein
MDFVNVTVWLQCNKVEDPVLLQKCMVVELEWDISIFKVSQILFVLCSAVSMKKLHIKKQLVFELINNTWYIKKTLLLSSNKTSQFVKQ